MAVTRIPIPDWARTQKADQRLELSLAEIDLPVRTVNCLEEQEIFTVDLADDPAVQTHGNHPQQLVPVPLQQFRQPILGSMTEQVQFSRVKVDVIIRSHRSIQFSST